MRISIIVTLCLLVGCVKPETPDRREVALAKRLQDAPPRTILVAYPLRNAGYAIVEVVCSHQGQFVEVARVGSWNCNSSSSKAAFLGTDTALNIVVDLSVKKVVRPDDSDYNDEMKNLLPLLIDLRRNGMPTGQ